MAELTYRDAVAAGIAQEMERDERVVFLGELHESFTELLDTVWKCEAEWRREEHR